MPSIPRSPELSTPATFAKSESECVSRSFVRIWPLSFSTYQIMLPGPKVNAVGVESPEITLLALIAADAGDAAATRPTASSLLARRFCPPPLQSARRDDELRLRWRRAPDRGSEVPLGTRAVRRQPPARRGAPSGVRAVHDAARGRRIGGRCGGTRGAGRRRRAPRRRPQACAATAGGQRAGPVPPRPARARPRAV